MAINPMINALQMQPQTQQTNPAVMQALFTPPPPPQVSPQIPQSQPQQVAAMGLPPIEDVHAMEMSRLYADAARRAIQNARQKSSGTAGF